MLTKDVIFCTWLTGYLFFEYQISRCNISGGHHAPANLLHERSAKKQKRLNLKHSALLLNFTSMASFFCGSFEKRSQKRIVVDNQEVEWVKKKVRQYLHRMDCFQCLSGESREVFVSVSL